MRGGVRHLPDLAGTVSDREARDALELIDGICADIEAWLRNVDPETTSG
jgi:hypothetical protein